MLSAAAPEDPSGLVVLEVDGAMAVEDDELGGVRESRVSVRVRESVRSRRSCSKFCQR